MVDIIINYLMAGDYETVKKYLPMLKSNEPQLFCKLVESNGLSDRLLANMPASLWYSLKWGGV